MITDDKETFYDVLDIAPDASAHEVREAYIRTKSTYNKDSVALYSIISTEEREETLKTIEEAYIVLSNPEKRREYDKNFGFFSASPNPFEGKVISIDRTLEKKPEEKSANLPVPPLPPLPTHIPSRTPGPTPVTPAPAPMPTPPAKTKETTPLFEIRPATAELDAALMHAIETEEEWKGTFLRRVRDAYKISIEEMAGITKVTKTYLLAVEEENYVKLPAAVYVRGFVTQMAKVLRLPHEKVASAYLSRYNRKRTD